MVICDRAVHNLVDKATHFCNTSFLQNQATKEIWKLIQHMCCPVCMGPPDSFVVDQGSSHNLKEMKEALEAFGILLDKARIEAPSAVGAVEKCHAPLRSVYERIRAATGRDNGAQKCLQLSVFVVDCTVVPEGLFPALLLLKCYPDTPQSSACTMLARNS